MLLVAGEANQRLGLTWVWIDHSHPFRRMSSSVRIVMAFAIFVDGNPLTTS